MNQNDQRPAAACVRLGDGSTLCRLSSGHSSFHVGVPRRAEGTGCIAAYCFGLGRGAARALGARTRALCRPQNGDVMTTLERNAAAHPLQRAYGRESRRAGTKDPRSCLRSFSRAVRPSLPRCQSIGILPSPLKGFPAFSSCSVGEPPGTRLCLEIGSLRYARTKPRAAMR